MGAPIPDPPDPVELPISEDTLADWQSVVDLMAELAGIPAGLIMRLVDDDIEVFVSSETEGNPYSPGDREHFADSGLYCETVINTEAPLEVPDALADPDWDDNPDIELGMISYLGFPILLPDGTPFGTICVLDSRPRSYEKPIRQLVEKFRDLLQHELDLAYANAKLGAENRRFIDHLEELEALRGLISICAWCKQVRDRDGNWQAVEKYLVRHPDSVYTHALCPDCEERLDTEDPSAIVDAISK